MQTQARTRIMTGSKIAATLSKSIIPALGTNRLAIASQGNPYTREDGTQVMIFNLNAFPTIAAAQAAAAHWKLGLALEKSGDVDGARKHFIDALNEQMSFSVLLENAPDFQAAYEINCLVEEITNKKGEKIIAVNRPRPVAVAVNGTTAANLFSLETPAPASTPTETAAQKRARLKAEKASAPTG